MSIYILVNPYTVKKNIPYPISQALHCQKIPWCSWCYDKEHILKMLPWTYCKHWWLLCADQFHCSHCCKLWLEYRCTAWLCSHSTKEPKS